MLWSLAQSCNGQTKWLYPVLDVEQRLKGVVTRKDLQYLLFGESLPSQEVFTASQSEHGTARSDAGSSEGDHYHEIPLQYLHDQPVIAYPDEPLRAVVYRMAEAVYTRLPVVERSDPRKLVGMISLNDLLKARVRSIEEERIRERVLRLRLLFPLRNEEKIKQNSPLLNSIPLLYSSHTSYCDRKGRTPP